MTASQNPAPRNPASQNPAAPGAGLPGSTAPIGAAPSKAALRRRSRSASARSAGADRSLTVVLGLVLLAAGALVALLSYGVFGAGRASRPLLDPIIVDALRAQPLLFRLVVIGAGVLLAFIGLAWVARSLRPERRPDLVLDGGPDTTVVVRAPAVAATVGEQAGALPGVSRARARTVGRDRAPALRLTVWLTENADVAEVLRRLDEEVLADARAALGVAALPMAVRLELDGSGSGRRAA